MQRLQNRLGMGFGDAEEGAGWEAGLLILDFRMEEKELAAPSLRKSIIKTHQPAILVEDIEGGEKADEQDSIFSRRRSQRRRMP